MINYGSFPPFGKSLLSFPTAGDASFRPLSVSPRLPSSPHPPLPSAPHLQTPRGQGSVIYNFSSSSSVSTYHPSPSTASSSSSSSSRVGSPLPPRYPPPPPSSPNPPLPHHHPLTASAFDSSSGVGSGPHSGVALYAASPSVPESRASDANFTPSGSVATSAAVAASASVSEPNTATTSAASSTSCFPTCAGVWIAGTLGDAIASKTGNQNVAAVSPNPSAHSTSTLAAPAGVHPFSGSASPAFPATPSSRSVAHSGAYLTGSHFTATPHSSPHPAGAPASHLSPAPPPPGTVPVGISIPFRAALIDGQKIAIDPYSQRIENLQQLQQLQHQHQHRQHHLQQPNLHLPQPAAVSTHIRRLGCRSFCEPSSSSLGPSPSSSSSTSSSIKSSIRQRIRAKSSLASSSSSCSSSPSTIAPSVSLCPITTAAAVSSRCGGVVVVTSANCRLVAASTDITTAFGAATSSSCSSNAAVYGVGSPGGGCVTARGGGVHHITPVYSASSSSSSVATSIPRPRISGDGNASSSNSFLTAATVETAHPLQLTNDYAANVNNNNNNNNNGPNDNNRDSHYATNGDIGGVNGDNGNSELDRIYSKTKSQQKTDVVGKSVVKIPPPPPKQHVLQQQQLQQQQLLQQQQQRSPRGRGRPEKTSTPKKGKETIRDRVKAQMEKMFISFDSDDTEDEVDPKETKDQMVKKHTWVSVLRSFSLFPSLCLTVCSWGFTYIRYVTCEHAHVPERMHRLSRVSAERSTRTEVTRDRSLSGYK